MIGETLTNNIGGNLFIGYHNPSAGALVTAASLWNPSQIFVMPAPSISQATF